MMEALGNAQKELHETRKELNQTKQEVAQLIRGRKEDIAARVDSSEEGLSFFGILQQDLQDLTDTATNGSILHIDQEAREVQDEMQKATQGCYILHMGCCHTRQKEDWQ